MPGDTSFRRSLVASILKLSPPSVREALLSDSNFRDEYGFSTVLRLSFDDRDVSVVQSEFFKSIRSAFKDPSHQQVVEAKPNEMFNIEVVNFVTGEIALCKGKQCLVTSDFWPLLPQVSQRIAVFEKMADAVNLPEETIKLWCEKLSHDEIADNIVDEVLSEFKDTPTAATDLINSQIEHGVSLSSLVPKSARYFHRLVGTCDDYKDMTDYVANVINTHIDQLISWRPEDGMALALLLSAHTSIVSAIDLDKVGKDNTIEVFKQLEEMGDRLSQIGAIELGLSRIKDWPEIEPHLIKMIEQIRDDDPKEERSRFRVLSSLIILVDGELSYSGLFKGKSPFLRRLASISHASLIERCLVRVPLDEKKLTNWAMQERGQQYYLQTLCDLRNEPKWMPDFVSADQIKMELIGRILNAAQYNAETIKESTKLTELLASEGPEGIKCLLKFPFTFFPGPLEGGTESCNELPPELEEAIQKRLTSEQLEPNSFYALINSSLLFKMKPVYAEIAARALRDAKHSIKQGGRADLLFPLLNGLAIVAAVTRSTEMANELRVLTRRSMRQSGHRIKQEEGFLVALVAAASHRDLKDWCLFIGEWLTEIAFGDMGSDDAKRMLSYIKCLCRIEPELWTTLGGAEAALAAYILK